MITTVFNTLLCTGQLFVIFRLISALRKSEQELPLANPLKGRLAVKSLAIISMLEFARVLYDFNGPGGHFPLGLGLVVLIIQTVMMLWAIY